ncbi:MAG: hypothetical protein K0B84_08020 [Firmicutes bacterium]|nr:hypothetical protein [Bacillota bacterium]
MNKIKGTVALIGSGELSGTMVETHKALLSKNGSGTKAFFLDTPAGFQENVDLIAQRAVQYFEKQVQHKMSIASFKSAKDAAFSDTERFFQLLSEAGFVLIGPGSPTYTVRQLKETPVPALLSAMVTRGGCLAVASAAALTMGTHTLPVYEIYKVGEELHWVEGLNILGHLGLNLVVIPHWNNAEGGNHDTRFCYMGKKRFQLLESMLPAGSTILGLDEHTACILDFSTGLAAVEGLGKVTVRCDGREQLYSPGDTISFEQLLCVPDLSAEEKVLEPDSAMAKRPAINQARGQGQEKDNSFWKHMHTLEEAFYSALENKNTAAMINQLLEADRLLWQAQLDLENPEFISQGRELFREFIVLAGTGIDQATNVIPRKYRELIDEMVTLRENYRREYKWSEADRIRAILQQVGVILEDTKEGPRWYFS